MKKGRDIEKSLGFGKLGQFYVCEEDQKASKLYTLNARFAACLVYSLVFASWLYMFLEYGSDYETNKCVLSAAVTGMIIAFLSNYSLRKYIAA